jgi:hypothetical protein
MLRTETPPTTRRRSARGDNPAACDVIRTPSTNRSSREPAPSRTQPDAPQTFQTGDAKEISMTQLLHTSNGLPAIAVDVDERGWINLSALTRSGVVSVGRFDDVASAWAALDAIDTQAEAA